MEFKFKLVLADEDNTSQSLLDKFSTHNCWDDGLRWKNLLKNLRLVLQSFGFFNLIKPWLKVFPIPHLSMGFERLIGLINLLRGAVSTSDSFKYYRLAKIPNPK